MALGTDFILPDTTDIALVVDGAGIRAPSFETVLSWYQNRYKEIYGADVILDNSTKDGQWVSIQAKAYYDVVSAAIGVYNAFSPSTAQGAGLSSVVKINGLSRRVATASVCDVLITGTAGTVLNNASIRNRVTNDIWALPAQVVIADKGQITVEARCVQLGAVQALPETLTVINTPTRGWSGVSNPAAATLGIPVETDGALRQRQAQSTMIGLRTILAGMIGALETLSGVTQVKCDENATSEPDSNGVPAHTISFVVNGGDDQEIAKVIANMKGLGVGTYGNTKVSVEDDGGQSRVIQFSRPKLVNVYIALDVTVNVQWNSSIGNAIQLSIAQGLSGLSIGETLYASRIYSYANLPREQGGEAYVINSIMLGTDPSDVTHDKLVLPYDQVGVIDASQVLIKTHTDF